MSRVLLCVRGGAHELPAVAGALHDRGAEPVVLDATAFPSGAAVTLAYDRSGFRTRWTDRLIEPRGIAAIWQGVVVGTALPAMEPGMRETCIAASELAVVGMLESFGVFQLDPFWCRARADNKPHQLRIAQRAGLDIPQTIITNDAEAVRAFARRYGPVIAKMLVQPASTGPQGADDESAVVFTTAMAPDDLEQLDGLDLCPMIFQERIENRRDVRVTVVGKRLFSAALDGADRGDDVDWRRESYALDRAPAWSPYELPTAVAGGIVRVVDHFGLSYATVDLIARPDGRHVFLELNAAGSFAFLGPHHAAPIAAAIADVLIDPAARRVAREL